MGDYPDATAVFDVDSIGLVNIVRNLNRGLDIGGNPTGNSTAFVIAVGANPGSPNIDEEIRRFEYKVEAGAELAVTQPVFDIRLLEEFMKKIEHFKVPVVAGIWPLTSTRNAEFMKNELRVSIPDEIFARMAKATTADTARAEGVAIARDMLAAVKDMVQGAQISAPFGRYSCAVDVLEALVEAARARSYNAIRASHGPRFGARVERTFRSSCGHPILVQRHTLAPRIFISPPSGLHYNQAKEFRACPSLKSAWIGWKKLSVNWKRAMFPWTGRWNLFDEGMKLSGSCRKELEEAEGKVEILLKRNGKLQAEAFESATQPGEAK